jgi:hypothetical protein
MIATRMHTVHCTAAIPAIFRIQQKFLNIVFSFFTEATMNQAQNGRGQLPTVYYNAPEVQDNRLSTPVINMVPQNYGGGGYNQLQPSALFSDYRKSDSVQVRRPIDGSTPAFYNSTPSHTGASAIYVGGNVRSPYSSVSRAATSVEYPPSFSVGASYAPYGTVRDGYDRVYRSTSPMVPSYERQGYISYSAGYPGATSTYPTTSYAATSYPASTRVSYPAGGSLYASSSSRIGNFNDLYPSSSIATPSYPPSNYYPASQQLPYSSVSYQAPYSSIRSAALPNRVAVGDDGLSYGESNVVNVNRSPSGPRGSPSRVVKGQGYLTSSLATSSFADNRGAYYRGGLANGTGGSYRVVAVGAGGQYNGYY